MTLTDLTSLETPWEELWQKDTNATPFQSPAWQIPWIVHLWKGGELLLLQERTDQKLTGFLPLFRWGINQTQVSFLGAGVSDYGDQLGSFRKLILPPDSLLEEVRQSSRLIQLGTANPISVCPVLSLKNYPETLNPKLKTDLRRAKNKLATNHRATFTRETNPEIFFKLHELRWHQTAEPNLIAFQREIAQRFSDRGLLRLHVLHIDEQPAAAIFAIAAHGTLYCYLSAFDPHFTKLSPGAVLLAHAIESAKAEGLTHADFLRGAEPYKYLWGAEDRVNFSVRPETNNSESTEPPAS